MLPAPSTPATSPRPPPQQMSPGSISELMDSEQRTAPPQLELPTEAGGDCGPAIPGDS